MLLNNVNTPNKGLSGLPLRVKGLYFLPAFVLVLISESFLFHILIILFFFPFTLKGTHVKPGKLLKLYSIPALFIVSGCAVLIFTVTFTGNTIMFLSINIDQNGFQQAVTVFCKSMAVFSVVVLGNLTLSISEINDVLKKTRFPDIFTELFIMSYRFINTLLSVTHTLYIAQRSRLAYLSKGKKLYHFSMLFSAVFHQAIMHTNQLDIALKSRNADSQLMFNRKRKPFKPQLLIVPGCMGFTLLMINLILTWYV